MYVDTCWHKNNIPKYEPNSEAYLKPCQITNMEITVKIVNNKSFQLRLQKAPS